MAVVEEICTITARGQTTVPKAVRTALGVGYGGRIAFRVEGGAVTVHALDDEGHHDPALAPFLALLERDLAVRPGGAFAGLDSSVFAAVQEFEVDPDAAIEGQVSL